MSTPPRIKRRVGWIGTIGPGGPRVRIVLPAPDEPAGLTVIQQEVRDDDLNESQWVTVPTPPGGVLRGLVEEIEALKRRVAELGG